MFTVLTVCCRNEIASCEEAAYESLPLKDALTLLFFNNQSELLIFAQQVCLLSVSFHTLTLILLNVAGLAGRPIKISDNFCNEGRRAS